MIQILHRADARSRKLWAAALITAAAAMVVLGIAMVTRTHALSGVVYVTPDNTQGWSSTAPLGDTRANGVVEFVADSDTPYGDAALRLATGPNTSINGQLQDKAQYMHAANVPLSQVTALGYSTKQVSASFAAGLPSYQLPVCLYGYNDTNTGCANVPFSTQSGFTTLVYEPYVDQGNAAVQNNVWQTWNVAAGKFWSSRTVAGLVGSQGSTTYTLDQIKANYPDAVVSAFGVNVGSNNPFYDTRVDGVVFNDTTYDFELVAPNPVPTTKDECKDGGWQTLVNTNGVAFKNQGQCVSFVAAGK